jgi:hypothetical protein
MAVKRIEIHPSALSELKSAISWYMERSETAALNFASASETAIAQIIASPQRCLTMNMELADSSFSVFHTQLFIANEH